MSIDCHCHIDFDVFDEDREHVIRRANKAGIEKIIIPGVTKSNWNKIKSCCEKHTSLYPCYGLHPYFLKQHSHSHLRDLETYIDKNKPIAVGECGLDFFIKTLDKTEQDFYFQKQLDIAMEFDLPVVIHARKSTEAVIHAIKKHPGLRGMIHSYSGSYEQALQLIKLGFYLSFGGPVTYPNSTRLHKLIKQLPLEHILVETDAPDQPVAHATDKRNEPYFVVDVINSIADILDSNPVHVSNVTAANTRHLFNL